MSIGGQGRDIALFGEYQKKWLLVCYISECINTFWHQTESDLTTIKFAMTIQKFPLLPRAYIMVLKYEQNYNVELNIGF